MLFSKPDESIAPEGAPTKAFAQNAGLDQPKDHADAGASVGAPSEAMLFSKSTRKHRA
jgi:hypothetical protein